jgi:hypothetical protein
MTSARLVFARIDSMDPTALADLLADSATMTFCNGEPMVGRDAIVTGSAVFFASIAGLRHRVLHEWTFGRDTIAESAVTYTRQDGGKVTIPAVSIWRVGAHGLIIDYRVFVDLAPVFAA